MQEDKDRVKSPCDEQAGSWQAGHWSCQEQVLSQAVSTLVTHNTETEPPDRAVAHWVPQQE